MHTTVQYFKYPETPHWRHEMVQLGADEFGVWLGAGVGAEIQKGAEAPRTMTYPFVQLISPESWWTLIYNGDGHPRLSHYVDIVTPAVWVDESLVTMIDVDLDVVMEHSGLRIDDEDEFLEHQKTLGYPPWLIDRTRVAAAEVFLAMEAEDAPFFGPSEYWLNRLIEG